MLRTKNPGNWREVALPFSIIAGCWAFFGAAKFCHIAEAIGALRWYAFPLTASLALAAIWVGILTQVFVEMGFEKIEAFAQKRQHAKELHTKKIQECKDPKHARAGRFVP